jgi:hypothetical protein
MRGTTTTKTINIIEIYLFIENLKKETRLLRLNKTYVQRRAKQ